MRYRVVYAGKNDTQTDLVEVAGDLTAKEVADKVQANHVPEIFISPGLLLAVEKVG